MSTPSFLFKVQRAFDVLLHTPMLPPPPAPPTVELADMDERSSSSSSSLSSTSSFANPRPDLAVATAEPAFPCAPHFPNYYAYNSPTAKSIASERSGSDSSFELDAEQAPAVRDMIAAATRDTL